jgi:glutaminase
VQGWVDDAHRRFGDNADGHVSEVYPALAAVPADLFGICVVGTNGRAYAVGDADHEFTITRVFKPFTRVIDAAVCHYTLAVMLTGGLYETSGDWLYDAG